LNAQRNSQLATILSMLPKSTTQQGSNTGTNTITGTNTQTGIQTGTQQQGGGIANAIAGGIAGFGLGGGFNNIPGASQIFGQNPQQRYQPNGIIPGATNPALSTEGFSASQIPSVPMTPQFNPNLSSGFPIIPTGLSTFGFGGQN
jgi:hypothetical protein